MPTGLGSSTGRLLLVVTVVATLPTAASAQVYSFPSGPSDWYGHETDSTACLWGDVDCAPRMIGDAGFGLLTVLADDDAGSGTAGVPFAGGSDRLIVARNNSALLRNRFYTIFDHSSGAFSLGSQPPVGSPTSTTAALDRVVVGAEHVFWEGRASIEVRLPISSDRDYSFDRLSLQSDGVIGNVGLVTKVQLAKSPTWALAGGIASQIPTAQGVSGQFGGRSFQVDSNVYCVSPFLALTAAPNSDWFYNGFAQVDFALGDSSVKAFGQSRSYDDPTLLRLNAGGGRWFFRRNHGLLRGMAGMCELHYTTALDDSNDVTLIGTGAAVTLGSTAGRSLDVLNLTSGLHLEFQGGSNARVAASVPLNNGQRFSDATLMVQFNVPL
jgi:hypothetical protein